MTVDLKDAFSHPCRQETPAFHGGVRALPVPGAPLGPFGSFYESPDRSAAHLHHHRYHACPCRLGDWLLKG